MHRAIFRNRAWLRLHAIGRHHIVNVCGNRGWNERPVFAALCATGLVAIFAEAGSVDGARETVHGFSASRDLALSLLRAWRATRPRPHHLACMFFACSQHLLL